MLLKPALLEHTHQPPSQWTQLAHGEWLLKQANQALKPVWPKLFGYHLASYGALAGALTSTESHIKHRCCVGPESTQVIAKGSEWPFAEHSLDAIVSAVMLEYETDPHQVLRDLTHSLIADGHLVLLGMNPLSPAILPGVWPAGRRAYPWAGRYFTRARVLDWLALLNYEVTDTRYFAPTWMWSKQEPPGWGMTRLSEWLPGTQSMYLIVARKREYPLTPLKARKAAQQPKVRALQLANNCRADDRLTSSIKPIK